MFHDCPVDDANPEILLRTILTTNEVLIVLYGRFTGMITFIRKQEGNIVAGVAKPYD
jgi:hypothetical protein